MEYTAKQIDRMSIEELESISYRLTHDQRTEWAACGYDGISFLEILNWRNNFLKQSTEKIRTCGK